MNGNLADLTKLFGERRAALEAGHTIPLYTSSESNGNIPPACALRLVTDDVTGEKSVIAEWIYCTDRNAHACTQTTQDGRLNVSGQEIDPFAAVGGNERLDEQRENVITYLIQADLQFSPIVDPAHLVAVEGFIGGPQPSEGFRSSNDNSTDRGFRQLLVWCVSDYTNGLNIFPFTEWCTDVGLAQGGDLFESINDLVDPAHESSIDVTATSPSTGSATEGDTVNFEVNSTARNLPITLSLSSGTPTLISPEGATLIDDVLRLPNGTDAAVIEVSGATPGTVTLTASTEVPNFANVDWVQSPTEPNDGKGCQVFATTTVNGPTALSGSASVLVKEKDSNSGGEGETPGGDEDGSTPGEGEGEDTPGEGESPDDGEGESGESGADSDGTDSDGADSEDAEGETDAEQGGSEDDLPATGLESPFLPAVAALLLVGLGVGATALRKGARN